MYTYWNLTYLFSCIYIISCTSRACIPFSILSLKCTSSTDDGAFWPRLQCFIVLLERLGNRIWQISVHKPDQLFTIIIENNSFHNAVMHWQSDEGEDSSSQEMFGDLHETRTPSGSSDTKHSSRFYKTALAWFQPFVQSVLDFDSCKDCLSLVINYLHNLAGEFH